MIIDFSSLRLMSTEQAVSQAERIASNIKEAKEANRVYEENVTKLQEIIEDVGKLSQMITILGLTKTILNESKKGDK